jgi:hypothetical protein
MRRFVMGLALGLIVAVGGMLALGADSPANVPKPGDVISGQDFGFRVSSIGPGYVKGTYVVRVNGDWRETMQVTVPHTLPAK